MDPPSAPPEPAPAPTAARPRADAGRAWAAAGIALAGLVAASGLGLLVWHHTDLDGDGLLVGEERHLRTDPTRMDTDLDGIGDGWEAQRGLNPLLSDSDGDGLHDRHEVDNLSDPLSLDTDRDGLADADEGLSQDCDQDGALGIRESDDDADARPDAQEPAGHRCDPDVDDDGVLDGAEGHLACVTATDCDTDGLDDLYERNASFDPLNPDTFGVGLEDAILDAFQRQGQQPSPDQDRDGIPDGWETGNGLIDWRGFAPQAGTRDLLIEYVRVHGPDSGRFTGLSFEAAYQQVANLFQAEAGIRVQWTETAIALEAEQVPTLIPSLHSDYYADVLRRARHSANPYVTTVVMNPQHDQSSILHAGVAPIRGMLAAVDYGVPTKLRFTLGQQSLHLSPLVESSIQGNRLDAIRAMGWDGGGRLANGELFLDAGDYIVAWRAHWFKQTPRIITDDGETIPLQYHSVSVDQQDLAYTIAHEVGHTLGLCHLDLQSCLAGISQQDRASLRTSTMHPGSTGLHFLPSEWANVGRYMACPPHGPVRMLAQNRTQDEVLEEKYGYALGEVENVGIRACGTFDALPRTLQPATTALTHEPPAEMRAPPAAANSGAASTAFFLGAAAFALLAAAASGLLARRRL